jgi:hypothetical protein
LKLTCQSCPSEQQCCPIIYFWSMTHEQHDDARQIVRDIAKTKHHEVFAGARPMPASSATRTLGSEISLRRSRMTAFPSALRRSGADAQMLHLHGLCLGHFRKGLGAVDRCDGAEGPLPPRAAINRRNLDRQLRGRSGPWDRL